LSGAKHEYTVYVYLFNINPENRWHHNKEIGKRNYPLPFDNLTSNYNESTESTQGILFLFECCVLSYMCVCIRATKSILVSK